MMIALLVVVVLLVLGGLIFAGWAGFGLFMVDERRVEQLEADAKPILDQVFGGGTDQVVYAPHDRSGGLSTETLVRGANERGYRMVSETGQMATRTVTFERAGEAARFPAS
jgi:hypothetical protein